MASSAPLETFSHALKCSDPACTTGQSVEETGRKIVSDFFGRNKSQTKRIPLSVWHMSCRKDYQRGAYAAKKAESKAVACHYYLGHIKAQLTRIQLWRPEAQFVVKLHDPAKARLTKYQVALLRNGGDEVSAKLAVAVTPKTNSKGENKPLTNVEAVDLGHADHLDANLCGQGKSLDDILTSIIPWIETQIDNGDMIQMPPVEFLIQKPQPGEPVIDPNDNYGRWIAHCNGEEYKTPEASPKSTPPSRKIILKLDPRPGFTLKVERIDGKLTASSSSSNSSSASASPSKKRKASSDFSDSDTPSKKLAPSQRTIDAVNALPLYQPPPPIKKLPAQIDMAKIPSYTTGIVSKAKGKAHIVEIVDETPQSAINTDHDDLPVSAYTTVFTDPIMAGGKVFAGSKQKRVIRSPIDENYEDEEIESESDKPAAKKQKVNA